MTSEESNIYSKRNNHLPTNGYPLAANFLNIAVSICKLELLAEMYEIPTYF